MDYKIERYGITKFNLTDEEQQPPFAYVVLTDNSKSKILADYLDYYLYRVDEFDKAYSQLKAEYARGRDLVGLYTVDFNTVDRTFRLAKSFYVNYQGKVIFDDTAMPDLHVVFYLRAGEWLNPED